MVTIVAEMLMNLFAVFVYLSSGCALGDLSSFFIRMVCLTSVGPNVCSGNSMSCETQPYLLLLLGTNAFDVEVSAAVSKAAA